MRHVWMAAFAASLFASTPGFAAGAGDARSKITSDCDQLEFRMQTSKLEGKRASCTASATSAAGQKVTKTFTGYVKKLDPVGSQGSSTEAVIIDETCEKCKDTLHYKFGTQEFAKIAEYAQASVKNDVDGLNEDDDVQTELREGAEACLMDNLGEPLKLAPAELLQCRITTLNTKVESGADVAYYRRYLEPELQRLVRSFKGDERTLGMRALQLIDQSHRDEPRIHESLKDMGHFLYYRAQVADAAAAIEAVGGNPQARAAEIAQLGQIQRQWTSTYRKRRDALEKQGVLDDELKNSSGLMENTLNRMYATYGPEIKQAQQAGAGGGAAPAGQGRTLFGQPQAAPRPSIPSAPGAGPRGAVQPGVPAPGGSPAGFNQRIFRSQ